MLVACPSCGCHARAEEARCPSCGAPAGPSARTVDARLMGLLSMALAAGCSGKVEGLGGADATSSTDASASASRSSSRATTATRTSTTTWNDIGATTAYGAGPTVSTGPVSCGFQECEPCRACAEQEICPLEFATCAADPACASLSACVDACPADDVATPVDERLACICGADALPCPEPAPAGTCFGDHAAALETYMAGPACVDMACALACD